jgi:hypothetical protein
LSQIKPGRRRAGKIPAALSWAIEKAMGRLGNLRGFLAMVRAQSRRSAMKGEA